MTNGRRLHVDAPGDGAWARRFRDLIIEMTNDLGGADLLGEGQRQLVRRAATISIQCEMMEAKSAKGERINLNTTGD